MRRNRFSWAGLYFKGMGLLFKQKVNTNKIGSTLSSSDITELEAQKYKSVIFSKQQSPIDFKENSKFFYLFISLFGLSVNKCMCLHYSYSLLRLLLEFQGYFWKLSKVWIHLNYIFIEWTNIMD